MDRDGYVDVLQSIAAVVMAIIALFGSLVTGTPGTPANVTTGMNVTPAAVPTIAGTSTPAPSPLAQTGWPSTGNPDVDFFCEVALAPFEQGNKSPVVRTWGDHISIDVAVAGRPTAEDLRQINASLAELNGLTQYHTSTRLEDGLGFEPGYRLEWCKPEYGGDLIIYIGPADQFDTYLNYYNDMSYYPYHRYACGDYDPVNGGYKIWSNSKFDPLCLSGTDCAVIVLPDTGYSQTQRSYYIWRYLAAVAGAHGSTEQYPDSIFSASPNRAAGYSGRDQEVIRTLYGRGLGPGMTYDQVVQTLIYHKPWAEVVRLDQHTTTFNG
jgi:hypothetical protein